jgi:hypothetical protein
MKKNKKTVTKSSRSFFENGMQGHSAVKNITSLNNDMYLIKRTSGRPLVKILVADIYIAGEADIAEIKPSLLDIDCIILIGFHNRYSYAAKELAKSMNVGLFDNREFFGAINYSGENLINYEKKTDPTNF